MTRGKIKKGQIDTEGSGNIATDIEVAQMISGSIIPESITLALDVNYQVWLNIPYAVTEFRETTINRTKLDLSNAKQVRLVARVMEVGGNIPSPPPELRLQFSLDENTWDYFDGISGPNVGLGSIGTKASLWVNIITPAKNDVFVRIVGCLGNQSADAKFGPIYLQVK